MSELPKFPKYGKIQNLLTDKGLIYQNDYEKWRSEFVAQLEAIQENRPLGTNKDLVVVYAKKVLEAFK